MHQQRECPYPTEMTSNCVNGHSGMTPVITDGPRLQVVADINYGKRCHSGGRQIIIYLSYLARGTQTIKHVQYGLFVALGSNLSFSWPTYILSITREYVFVHSTMGQQKQTSDITVCPQRYNCCLFSTFRWPFSLISAYFVILWKGRINQTFPVPVGY